MNFKVINFIQVNKKLTLKSKKKFPYLLKSALCLSSVLVNSVSAVVTKLRSTVLQGMAITEIKRSTWQRLVCSFEKQKTSKFELSSYLLRLLREDSTFLRAAVETPFTLKVKSPNNNLTSSCRVDEIVKFALVLLNFSRLKAKDYRYRRLLYFTYSFSEQLGLLKFTFSASSDNLSVCLSTMS